MQNWKIWIIEREREKKMVLLFDLGNTLDGTRTLAKSRRVSIEFLLSDKEVKMFLLLLLKESLKVVKAERSPPLSK